MSRAELGRLGVTPARLRVMAGHGAWETLRRGIYAEAGQTSLQRLLAAAEVALGGCWVASHGTAAALHGLVLLRPPVADGLVLTVPPATRKHSDLPGIHFHRAALAESQVCMVEGFAVTSVARTLVDLARRLPPRDALAAVDAALHSGQVECDELRTVVHDCAGGPGSRRAATVVELGDPAAESPLESVSRLFFVDHDIPMPLSQVTLRRGGVFVARADFWWESQRVAGEADGLAKYTDADVLRAEKLRQERVEDLGIRMVRWTWQDIVRPAPARHTADRIRRALALTA